MTTLRIGTRGSALALAQTQTVADALAAATGASIELVTVTTAGDRSTEPLAELGGTGVFATALRESLLAGDCDLVVHSLKDLPTAPYPGLTIGAVPVRADARDALCSRDGAALGELAPGSRIGTGSPRRAAQVRARRSDLDVVDVRGNVDTRLGKVASGELDGVILAAAGLHRIGRADAISELFELNDWPTAPGQGALALEVRVGDEHLVSVLEDPATRLAVDAERRVLAILEGGCSAPIGANAFADDGLLFLTASVYSLDGSRLITASHAVTLEDAGDAAGVVAAQLFDAGAADLTGAAR
jgi:hydroxymethylbilane synthase